MSSQIPPELAVQIFENARIPLAIVDPDGIFRYVNQAYCEVLGCLTDKMVIGTHFKLWTHPDYIEADEKYAAQVKAGEIPGYVMDKVYNQYGSTKTNRKESCGQLLVLGMWEDQKFVGYQAQFLPTHSRITIRNAGQVLQWLTDNKATILLVLTALAGTWSALTVGNWSVLLQLLRPQVQESRGSLDASVPELSAE